MSKDTSIVDVARAFKALGDGNRVRILELLRGCCGPEGCTATEATMQRTVSELAAELDLALSTVSHHLKELRQAGLITCTRQGQRIHCAVNETMLASLQQFLAGPEPPLIRIGQPGGR